jgi:hypothetical protein
MFSNRFCECTWLELQPFQADLPKCLGILFGEDSNFHERVILVLLAEIVKPIVEMREPG